tara:strand:- start:468 stop:869 length:402 start_codon:yes stop_codon:yes gene_type:complete
MASVKMIEDGTATAEVQSIYEDIKKTREIAYIPNIWKTLATHPPTLKRIWLGIKTVMAPGRLDPLTKEMIAVAVSATNNCDYCIRSHTAAARKLGMDNEMLGELMAVVGMFNQTNRLANGYQIEVDEQYLKTE